MDDARKAQAVIDAALSLAGMIGIPGVSLGAKLARGLVDAGFDRVLAAAEERIRTESRAGAAAGQAAAVASAVTTALEHERAAPVLCGQALPVRNGRAYHGADCAAHAGCGKAIERVTHA